MKRALFLTLLLAGCDASEPTEYVPTYDPASTEPVAMMDFCALLARNTCAVLRPCCRALPFAFEEAKCRVAARAQCEARRVRSMELGLEYDDVQAGRCVRGTAIMLPECRTPNDRDAALVTEACRMVFHGSRRVGQPCSSDNPVDCAPPALGVRVGCFGTCRVINVLPGGELCGGGAPSQCEAGLVCEGEPARCTARFHPLGAPCTPAGAVEADRCDISRDRFCDFTESPAICKSLPTLGDECDAVRGCARPYRCDTDRDGRTRCTEGKPLGALCADDRECASKLCTGAFVKACVPSGIGPPIASTVMPKSDPIEYVARIAAACSGVIPEGAGGLTQLLPLPAAD